MLPVVTLGVPPVFTDPAASGKWLPIGPTVIASSLSGVGYSNGRVDSVAISPADERIVLMGANGGGIWRSEDGGASFSLASETDGGVPAIEFSTADPAIAYAMATGDLGLLSSRSVYDGSFLRSSHSGRSWSKRQLPYESSPFPGIETARIRPDPRDRNRVLITTYGAVWSSPDGGLTWSKALSCGVCDVAYFSIDPSIWLVSRESFGSTSPAGVYRSTDGGRTWSLSFSGPFAPGSVVNGGVLGISPSSGTAYWCANARLFLTRDMGITWSERASAPPPGPYFPLPASCPAYIAVTAANPDMLYYGFDQNDLFVSADAGATFVRLADLYQYNRRSPLHTDNRGFALSQTASYFGTDGGLYKGDAAARNVSALNQGVGSTVQFYSITASPGDPALILGGTQDNGLLMGDTHPGLWRDITGGDVGAIVFDANNPANILWSLTNQPEVYRLTNMNSRNALYQEIANVARLEPGTTRQVLNWFGRGMPLARNQRGTVYTGTWRLYSSNDFGSTWSRTSDLDLTRDLDGIGGDMLAVIAIAVGDDNVIYTVSGSNRVMRTGDGGKSWGDITPESLSHYEPDVRTMVVLGGGPTAIMGLNSGRGLLRTVNSGATWTPVLNFPAVSMQALYSDRFEPGVVYAGTDSGVFRSTDEGMSWSFYGSGLPPCAVSGLTRTADGRLIAATYGRGAYVFMPPAPPRRRSAGH